MSKSPPSQSTDAEKPKRFRVAFSFAGEKREFVSQVAGVLAKRFSKFEILYDKYHEAELARYDLGIYLPKLYREETDLVVAIICPAYDEKLWTGWEWTAIQSQLNKSQGKKIILCRFDHATAEGLHDNAGYVELDDKTPEEAASIILERLALNEGRPNEHYAIQSPAEPQRLPVSPPKVIEDLRNVSGRRQESDSKDAPQLLRPGLTLTTPEERRNAAPVVFISYAWERGTIKSWVANLAADLTSNGLTVIYDDESHLPGASNTAFMRESCQKADWILCVATPEYRKRCTEQGRGPEFEAEWIEKRGLVIGKNNVVALLRKGQASTSLPPFKDGENSLDFRTANKYDASLQKLLKWMGYARGPASSDQVVWRSGLVLLCDINGFSRLRKEPQVRIMNLLWRELGAVAAKVRKKWDHSFPLLDGCGLIWNDVDVHDAVLEVARHLIGRVREETGGFCLRVGLHSGPFTFQKMRKEATRYWGVGLNDAWRASNLGDAGSLLITDTFYLTARDNGLPGLALQVHPPEEERGLEIFPTQGHGGRFRIYRGGGTYEAIPSRVEMRLAVREKLRDDLIQIAFDYGKLLEGHAAVPIGELKPRVTVWLPDLFVPGHLSATTHRYRVLEDESDGEFDVEITESKSGTIYSTVQPGEGPPGMAWANGGTTAVVANDLPDFEEDSEKYVRRLEGFGLGRAKVEALGRKSRMIAACAFPMKSNKAGLPVGVLCLDTEHPLGDVPRDELERLAADLVSDWATILTLALNFRI